MKYDDGFVAYLNGEKIIEQSLRDGESPDDWDTRATIRRTPGKSAVTGSISGPNVFTRDSPDSPCHQEERPRVFRRVR